MESVYLGAFTTGLLGGFGHCAGMCGPVVASFSIHQTESVFSRFFSHLFYNGGRISTYMCIGGVAGSMGSYVDVSMKISGLQSVVAFIAGIFLIIMGLHIAGISGKIGSLERRRTFLFSIVRHFIGEESVWKFFPLGALFGLMPCGVSYSQFVSAAGSGSFYRGMLITLFFGIGTIPALLFFGLAASLIGSNLRGIFYRAAGATIVLLGIFYLLRTLNLYGYM